MGQAHLEAEHRELPPRRCFVTIGATAAFRALLDEVSTADFLRCLAEHGYGRLDVQCGPDLDYFRARMANLGGDERHGIAINYFAYTDDMDGYILACRSERGVRPAGCVIAHAGRSLRVLHQANRRCSFL